MKTIVFRGLRAQVSLLGVVEGAKPSHAPPKVWEVALGLAPAQERLVKAVNLEWMLALRHQRILQYRGTLTAWITKKSRRLKLRKISRKGC